MIRIVINMSFSLRSGKDIQSHFSSVISRTAAQLCLDRHLASLVQDSEIWPNGSHSSPGFYKTGVGHSRSAGDLQESHSPDGLHWSNKALGRPRMQCPRHNIYQQDGPGLPSQIHTLTTKWQVYKRTQTQKDTLHMSHASATDMRLDKLLARCSSVPVMWP